MLCVIGVFVIPKLTSKYVRRKNLHAVICCTMGPTEKTCKENCLGKANSTWDMERAEKKKQDETGQEER